MSVPILPTISTAFIIISAIFVIIGWIRISKRNIDGHKKAMLLAGYFALAFFIVYASRTIFLGNTAFGGPDQYKIYYTIFLIFHINLATIGAVLGIISIRSGLKNNLKLHRKLGPISSVIWIFTAITGIAVYLLLYVFFAGGETTSLIKAILGF